MMEYGNWIAGEERAAVGGDILVSTDPRDGTTVATIARSGAEDVAAAVAAAEDAKLAWRRLRPIERGRLLISLGRAIEEHSTTLAQLESSETGKPAWQSPMEMAGAAAYFEFYGGLVNVQHGETIDLGPDHHCFTRREPFGVVGVITPWNAPLNQIARAVAPALAVGNTVVVKPSEFTSSTAIELARLTAEVGFPAGVFNVVTGTGEEAGEHLVKDTRVRKLAFTGSPRAGRLIGHIAAERILPLTLELGGKSANIVFADADLDQAAQVAVAAFMINSGQVCSAGTRLLVHRSVHDEFVERLVAEVNARMADEARAIGPLTTPAQYDKVVEYLDIATGEGAVAVVGGAADPSVGPAFVPPAIFTGVDNSMRIAREEVFGPVLAVIPFDEESEAVSITNDSDYGLAAGVWTRDISRALRVSDALEAGQVHVNTWLTAAVETPFGGYKESGYGREKGLEALHHYSQLKCVTVAL